MNKKYYIPGLTVSDIIKVKLAVMIRISVCEDNGDLKEAEEWKRLHIKIYMAMKRAMKNEPIKKPPLPRMRKKTNRQGTRKN